MSTCLCGPTFSTDGLICAESEMYCCCIQYQCSLERQMMKMLTFIEFTNRLLSVAALSMDF